MPTHNSSQHRWYRGLALLGLASFLVGPGPAAAQQTRTLTDTNPDLAATPPTVVVPDSSLADRGASFPGGEAALLNFIRARLRYPSLAARNRIEGKVVVSFWLDERGHPFGFGVLKGLGAGLDEEAIRILREMPDWLPAIVAGKPALLQMRIPVVFRLGQ